MRMNRLTKPESIWGDARGAVVARESISLKRLVYAAPGMDLLRTINKRLIVQRVPVNL